MYFVYLLLCSDKSIYTGITTDINRRFKQHQQGKGGAYTRSHPPLKIIYQEQCLDKSSALKRELQIKSWTRQKKIDIFKIKKISL
jgi:putative endonuclease